MDKIELAKEIVESAFKGKVDLAGKPYVYHIWRVWESAADMRPSQINREIVAVLHDLLEDCPEWNAMALRSIFGDIVTEAVVALTKSKAETYEAYIDRVLTNDIATVVKRFDLEDNMDIRRLPVLNENGMRRLYKYHAAYIRICERLNIAI